jgi:hypothetical protein
MDTLTTTTSVPAAEETPAAQTAAVPERKATTCAEQMRAMGAVAQATVPSVSADFPDIPDFLRRTK